MSKIDEILNKRKIIITCGTGGVGKTTLSAAIGIRAALLGKKTVVITIDPAKRLSTSLGIQTLGDQPSDLTPQIKEALKKSKIKLPKKAETLKGSLAAIVPDTRKTFESFVHEMAPHPGTVNKILKSPIFQIFAKEFSGTNEYMALERLLSLSKQQDYDCIILDTPPSRNTLAFLNAPKVLSQFFEEKIIRLLVIPANKIVSMSIRKALGILEKLTGNAFMSDLFEFTSAIFEVRTKFSTNLQKIIDLLVSPQVGFLMVAAPAPDTVPEAAHFIDTLKEHRFHFEGVALNRTLSYLPIQGPEKGFEEAFQIIEAIQKREQLVIENLMRNPIAVCAKLPELARDIHSVEDLFHVALALGDYTSSMSTQE